MKLTPGISRMGWGLAAAIALSLGFSVNPVASADEAPPQADDILRSMSSYMAETRAFSVDADISLDVVTEDGMKLQYNSFSTIVLERPNRFYIERRGIAADLTVIFDGDTLTLLGNRGNSYAQLAVNGGDIDDAIRAFEGETGIPAPGADLMFANIYAVLSEGVEDSAYIGVEYVHGVPCYHLAFRENGVDWQIWIQTGDRPLPMKYVITSKWQLTAPQYSISLRNWNTNPRIDAAQFTFSPPAGATQLPSIPASMLDEFTSTTEAQ